MTTRLLIVGGYGAVGVHLGRELLRFGGIEVLVAGRHPERAAALGFEGRRLDLGDPGTWREGVADVDHVVMCMDHGSTAFAEFLFTRGIGYIDLSAEDRLFRRIEALPPPSRSTGLLSVGLAPGLTNLLAIDAASRLEHVSAIEIGLLFGLGDAHGAAGVAWTARKLFDPTEPRGAAVVDFGRPWGLRRAHRLGFSDQYALERTLGHATTTLLAFESRLATAAAFGIARQFAGNGAAEALTAASFGLLRFGSRAVEVSVTARGSTGGEAAAVTHRFHGEVETRTTARLAALQIRDFLAGRPPPGVWHSHQLLHAAAVLAAVATAGIGRLELDPRGSPVAPLPNASDRLVLRRGAAAKR